MFTSFLIKLHRVLFLMVIPKGSNSQANVNATFKFVKMVVGANLCTKLLKIQMTENEVQLVL